MSQPSEDRLSDPPRPGEGDSSSARILPFERPPSELQQAIRQRAQEAIDREAALEREDRRPKPLKWLIVFLIALIPVLLIFAAVDAFLRVFYKVNEIYLSEPPAATAPAEPIETPPPASQQPGVVILQPFGSESEAARAIEESVEKAGQPTPGDER